MQRYLIAAASSFALVSLLSGCGGSGQDGIPAPAPVPADYQAPAAPATAWPATPPADALQPWEQQDARGRVIPDAPRGASAINADSEFVPGVERFLEGSGVSDNGEATSLSSTAGAVSYAIYRIPLGGSEPGVISVDANLTAGDGYYLGLGNYAADAWEWHGPFGDSHVRLDTNESGDFTSGLGNVFVCILAYGGAAADVVGIGVNSIDPEDSTAPPGPEAPSLTAVAGGLLAEWLPVTAGDLAGYRIYYSDQQFENGQETGVQVEESLEGLTNHLLLGLTQQTYVRLSAVDTSGNESALSDSAAATPLGGSSGSLALAITAPSAMLNEPVMLTASGAESYDIDQDGDGIYDITGAATGEAAVDTSGSGMIRPRVMGTSEGGSAVALGGLSLIVTSYSRPVAVAQAAPASGDAPLLVSFSGADSTDFDGEIVGGGWDFDGDGTYDVWADDDTSFVISSDHTYTDPGVYNAKLRVVDNDGTWDVDTVTITVGDPANQAPTAVLQADSASGSAPLAVSFDASTSSDSDGSIVRYDYDFEDDGTWDAYDAGDAVEWTYSEGGSYTAMLRVTDDRGGQATDTVEIDVNAPPLAQLSASPTEGEKGVTVRYDAGGSSDSDGSIDDYEWDLDNNGLFNESGDEADNQGNDSVLQVYPEPGYKTVTVRVTDDDAATDTASFTATVHGWVTTTVDNTASVGEYTSLAVVDGNPAISYYRHNGADGDLRYVRALDASGSDWDSVVVVDTTDDAGPYNSLAVVDGYPAISYHVADPDYDLRYVRASDAQGSSWGTPVTVDSTDFVGRHSSLLVVDGNPAIGYYDSTNTNVEYVRATDATGSTWGTPVTVYGTGIVGIDLSMALVNGNPAISYHDNNPNFDLMYVRASDAAGTSWGTPVPVDTSGDVGTYTSLAVVQGYPAICYLKGGDSSLKYARANNANGSSWGTPLVLDNAESDGWYGSLAVVDGHPMCSYYNGTTYNLKFIEASDASGSSWSTPATLDSTGFVGKYTSIADINGLPGISYWDESNQNLKYAVRY